MPDSIQIGILVLGAVLLLIAILGGNFKLFGAEVTATVSNRFLRFTAFALGTALLIIAIGLPAFESTPPPPEPTPTASPTLTVSPTPTASPTATPSPPPPEPTPDGLSDCRLTIRNPLVSLMSEPDQFSREIIRVQPGDYPALGYETASFGPQEQGWFMIEAEGRQGWIKDDTWTIERKSAQCP
ncbi:hypothetical protein XM38_032690 [Halomicronema hongdechloris C2206]|uniref:SH3b domain-containing protein n=1 Tax=Halomicronema hongdechloris C2206 TaxID=1641165 RepID=A0A1Z3HPY8_9CYAN|nr:hypothetical protein [Halomicronema hongdechloris]ASC72312.1 hypothetical protein XM38_032690 [Halomicronema hongdechloris C2206]